MISKLQRNFTIIYILSIMFILAFSLFFVYSYSYNSTMRKINTDLNRQQQEDGQKHEDKKSFNDLVIIEHATTDLKSLIENYQETGYEINEDKNIITNGEEYYIYKVDVNATRILNISRDVYALKNLSSNLILIFILSTILFSFFGILFIRKMITPIKENDLAQEQFISDASHEIKTPLSVMRSCINQSLKNPNEVMHYIPYMQLEVERLTNLSDNLLMLSTRQDNVLTKVDISHATNLVLVGVEVQLFELGFILSYDIDDDILVKINKDHYIQLLHILIDNAKKYNNEDKEISISLKKINHQVHLKVSNTTNELKVDDLNHLTDRFYRLDQARSSEAKGFGLGLTIAKHLVVNNKAKLNFEYSSNRFIANVRFKELKH